MIPERMRRPILLVLGLAFFGLVLAELTGDPGRTAGRILIGLASALAFGMVFVAREIENDLPQCDTCGPMYFGEHHPDCPKRPWTRGRAGRNE
jgi:hypothetical protein